MSPTSLHGVIIINKPPDLTSQAVVTRVKKILNVRKAGHTGTLDPFATGVLPVCVNEGTKLSPFLMEGDKEYVGVLLLGVETDTQDLTGTIIRRQDPTRVSEKDIEKAFSAFRGVITQIPPMFSAIKQNGVPLYTLARQGVEVKRPTRTVTIYSLEIITIELPRVSFRVACSKGTYVRALVSDIGKQLTCGACLQALRRTRSGQFGIERSLDLEVLQELSEHEIAGRWLITPAEALPSFSAVVVDGQIERKVRQGMAVSIGELEGEGLGLLEPGSNVKVVNNDGDLVAVAQTLPVESCRDQDRKKVPAWKLLRVFNVG